MTTAVTSTGTATTAADASKSEQSRTKLAANMDMFLTMLTTQLKNQDPLSPMDSTQFTQQLVQFAGVEQQISANSNLEKLISLQQNNEISGALSYIGNTIKAESSQIAVQNGQADFTYLLANEAEAVTITIRDSNGGMVKEVKLGHANAGEHNGAWDGKSTDGAQLPDGAYKVTVTATAKDGTVASAPTSMIARVTAVSNQDGTSMLSMSGVEIPVSKVISISQPITSS